MRKAAEVREGASAEPSARETAAPAATAAPSRGMFDEVIQSAQEPPKRRERQFEHHSYIDRKYGGLSGMILGPQARFILGMALLLPFLLWLYQNRAAPVAEVAEERVQQVQQGKEALAEPDGNRNPRMLPHIRFNAPSRPLELIGMPQKIAPVLGTWNTGAAAVILLISALFAGRKLGLVLMAAAALMIGGHLLRPMPAIGVLERWGGEQAGIFVFPTTLAAGLLLCVLGFAFAREK